MFLFLPFTYNDLDTAAYIKKEISFFNNVKVWLQLSELDQSWQDKIFPQEFYFLIKYTFHAEKCMHETKEFEKLESCPEIFKYVPFQEGCYDK